MALEAGRKLGLYEILDPIGVGGMREVYYWQKSLWRGWTAIWDLLDEALLCGLGFRPVILPNVFSLKRLTGSKAYRTIN